MLDFLGLLFGNESFFFDLLDSESLFFGLLGSESFFGLDYDGVTLFFARLLGYFDKYVLCDQVKNVFIPGFHRLLVFHFELVGVFDDLLSFLLELKNG